MKILGVDPGGTTGYATLTVENKVMTGAIPGTTKDQTLVDIIDLIREADVVVCEEFRIRPAKAMKGSFNWQKMPAIRVIGALETLCKLHQKQLEMQNAADRVPGYGFVGMVYKNGAQGRHWQDALAHAAYYAVKKLHSAPLTGKLL